MKMQVILTTILMSVFSFSCKEINPAVSEEEARLINANNNKIETRFSPPSGFYRIKTDPTDFGFYLRNLPLKPHGAKVFLYDGTVKKTQDGQAAVVDISVGAKDLQQCADAVMRLRAEYLWHKKWYDSICFTFTNGFKASYKTWRSGKTIKVHANHTTWVNTSDDHTTYDSFMKYMELVFTYCGTLSLSKDLKPISDLNQIKPGDVFIRGGSPGHAVIVVDVAENAAKQKVFMIAQSYMPAQSIHILRNFENKAISPWFAVDDIKDKFYTPDYTFTPNELMRF